MLPQKHKNQSSQFSLCRCPRLFMPLKPFCRSPSYTAIATEFERLSERSSPIMGMRTHSSGWALSSSSGSPRVSFQNTKKSPSR